MGIDNISQSNSINRSIIEQNNDLSKEEKANLLSVFDAVDEQEDDNQKGIITSSDSLSKFLGQIKDSIGDKYNKFLDSVNLSFLKNDKNTNGVIDENDFSEEELNVLKQGGIISIFNIFNNQKWSKETSEVISAILNPKPNDTKEYKTVINSEAFTKNIIFDSKNRELKLTKTGVKGLEQYESYKLNDKNQLIEQTIINEGSNMYKRGAHHKIGSNNLAIYAQMRGFDTSEKLTKENYDKYNQYFENNLFGDKWTYEYNNDGTLKSEYLISITFDNEKKETFTENEIVIKTISDNNGQFKSKEKIYPDYWEESDEGDVHIVKTENYDENDNLLYTTEEKTISLKEPIINYNNEGFDADTKVIITKIYPDGRKEITTEIY